MLNTTVFLPRGRVVDALRVSTVTVRQRLFRITRRNLPMRVRIASEIRIGPEHDFSRTSFVEFMTEAEAIHVVNAINARRNEVEEAIVRALPTEARIIVDATEPE